MHTQTLVALRQPAFVLGEGSYYNAFLNRGENALFGGLIEIPHTHTQKYIAVQDALSERENFKYYICYGPIYVK